VAAGADAIKFGNVVSKVIVPAVPAPVAAGLIATVGTCLVYRVTARAERGGVTRGFKGGQVVSASLVSLAHGTDDARKTMGVITLALVTSGHLAANSDPPVAPVAGAAAA